MGITQINIKINQTNQVNGGSPNLASKSVATVNPFDQVLAMYNLPSQTPVKVGQVNTLSLQNGTEQMGNIPTDLLKFNQVSDEETLGPMIGETAHSDLEENSIGKQDSVNLNSNVDNVMYNLSMISPTAVINNPLNQDFNAEETQNSFFITDEAKVGTHTSVETNTVNPLSDTNLEVAKVLAQGLELVKRMEKPSALDSSELLHKVTQLLKEIQQFQGNKITPEIPPDTKEKIQIILNGIKAAQKSETLTVLNSQDLTQGLSLDKNQVIHSAFPHIGKSEQVYNRYTKVPAASSMDELTKVNGQLTSLNHIQHLSGNDLKEMNLPSSMDVTNFAPEVSEWISRFMKITNGKFGSTEAKFSLFPEHLGHIEIKVTTQQGQISAQIFTDTTMAKDALEGQLQHLKQALQQSGLHVQKLDVVQQTSVTTESSQTGFAFSQDGSHSSREQRSYTGSSNNRNEQNEFSDQIENNGEIKPIFYGGTAQKTSTRIDFTA